MEQRDVASEGSLGDVQLVGHHSFVGSKQADSDS